MKKILSQNELLESIEIWKKENKVIGFTNGCFDILHFGHVSSFRQSKKHCDILIVGYNSDASVRRLKGSKRPINNQNMRAQVLAELKSIDAVIVFEEDTALELVKKVKPDVICKEGYAIDKWIEAQYVESYGGKSITLNREDCLSTTDIENLSQ